METVPDGVAAAAVLRAGRLTPRACHARDRHAARARSQDRWLEAERADDGVLHAHLRQPPAGAGRRDGARHRLVTRASRAIVPRRRPPLALALRGAALALEAALARGRGRARGLPATRSLERA